MLLDAYLNRVGFTERPRPDFETLRALHRAHLLAVPYENLDVHLHRPVGLDPLAAHDKIVGRGRGGWCYEMNGLFGWALGEIGFRVTRLAAGASAPHSHLLLRVDLDEPWIADVGYSDGMIAPYRPKPGEFTQRGFTFRVEQQGAGWRLNNHRYGVSPFYDVAGENLELEMADRCHWLQTAPDSVFVQNVVVCRHNEAGYTTMIGRVLRQVTPDGIVKTLIDDAKAYVEALDDLFGLTVPEAAALWPSICARHEAVLAAKSIPS